jgi:predicted secreted Zn-dependent protease
MTRWLSIAALALGLSPAAAEPLVKRNVVHYDVSGASAQEIRAEMDRLGPIDETTKRRSDATTRWYVKWTYRYRNVGQDCAIARVSVTVDVTITMPRLKPGSPVDLARTFSEYTDKLREHEEGHAQNGIEIGTASRLRSAISSRIPPAKSSAAPPMPWVTASSRRRTRTTSNTTRAPSTAAPRARGFPRA